MIDRATIDKIVDAADIVDVIGDFITLKKKGVNYWACCPFHGEKTPSFSVSPSKGIYKCFGCGKAGNAVGFVMDHESMTYVEALKYLARKYNIEVRERELTTEEQAVNNRRESMMVLSSYAQDVFEEQLWEHAEGKAIGRSYFRERGFTDKTIRKFRLGYALDNRTAFSTRALDDGYKKEFLTATGLSIEREGTGELFDRFAGRVLFPVHSLSGRVIAFGGRTLRQDKAVAKYLNSPESDIYHKSNVLYGIFQAKQAITRTQKCYLVEGYTDVISMHQAGIENVVASSGTSLTTEQIRLIKRFTSNVTVLYDGDAAGIKASLRGIDMLLEEGLNVKVALFPDGEDPDSFARKHNAAEFESFLADSEKDFISFKTKLLSDEAQHDPLLRAGLIKDVVRSIGAIPDAITRTVYAKECSRLMDIGEDVLLAEVARLRRDNIYDGRRPAAPAATPPPDAPTAPALPPPAPDAGSYFEKAEEEITCYLLKYGRRIIRSEPRADGTLCHTTAAEYITTELQSDGLTFTHPRYRRLFDEYLGQPADSTDEELCKHFIHHPDRDLSDTATALLSDLPALTVQHFIDSLDPETSTLSKVIPKMIMVYKSRVTRVACNEVAEQLKKAQEQAPGDFESLKPLLERLRALQEAAKKVALELNRLTF